MASKREVGYRTYIIPENFTNSGRFYGFQKRNALEGGILGGVCALLTLLIPIDDMQVRIPVLLFAFCIPFLIGVAGYNGDPLFYALRYIQSWNATKGIILYNGNTRFLEESPLDSMMEQTDMRDRIVEMMERRRAAKEAADKGKTFIEGVDFEFDNKEDSLARVVAPDMEDGYEDGDAVEVVGELELVFENSDGSDYEDYEEEVLDVDVRPMGIDAMADDLFASEEDDGFTPKKLSLDEIGEPEDEITLPVRPAPKDDWDDGLDDLYEEEETAFPPIHVKKEGPAPATEKEHGTVSLKLRIDLADIGEEDLY